MLRRSWLLALALALLVSGPVHAQPGGKKNADVLFKEGRTAFDKGDYATACKKFEASQAADPAVGTLLNLALCEERSGKLVRAKKHLEEVIPALPPKDERVGFAKDLAAKVEARVPTLTLALAPGAPAGTTATDEADGAAIPLNTAVPLDPGDHTFVVNEPGKPAARLSISLTEGQRESRQIGTAAAAPVAPAPSPAGTPSSSGRIRRTIGFALGGVGVAGFGLAAVTGAVLLGKKSDLDSHCPNQKCDPTGVKLLEESKSTGLVPLNTVGSIFGITGVTVGGALVLTSRIGEEPASTAAIGPVFFGDGAGLGASGTF